MQALFAAGAGSIGNYNECSFTSEGIGTYKGNEWSSPVIGQKFVRETVKEVKIEVTFEKSIIVFLSVFCFLINLSKSKPIIFR